MSVAAQVRTVMLQAAIQPRQAFTDLCQDPRHAMWTGLATAWTVGVLYTLTVAGLALIGAHAAVEPWLPIDRETYYTWQILFTVPVFLVALFAASGVAHVLALGAGGRGSYEATLGALGVATTLPWIITWVVETALVLLALGGVVSHPQWLHATSSPGVWRVFAFVYQLVPLLWMMLLVVLALQATHQIPLRRALLPTISVMLTIGTLGAVFIR